MFYGNGTAPWNRHDHVVIPVQVDPNLPTAVTELACDGFPLWSTRCDILELSAHSADMFEVRIDTPDLGGAPVLIEIERSNPPMTRACNQPVTDAVSGVCYAPHPVNCAVSGSIAITGLEDDQTIEGTLDLTFESGGTITGTFAIRSASRRLPAKLRAGRSQPVVRSMMDDTAAAYALGVHCSAVRGVMVIGSALGACGSDAAAPPENECPGAPPTLDDCFVGRNYADCGGTAAPVFACSQQGDCRWFLAGCTPADYRRSGCPADDVCCVDEFPYTDAIDFRCPDWAAVSCATAGSVVVSSVDDASAWRGTVDLTFAGGATLSGSFVTP